MKALGGQPFYVRPGTSDAYNATWYYRDISICRQELQGAARHHLGDRVEHRRGFDRTWSCVSERFLLGLEPDPQNAPSSAKH